MDGRRVVVTGMGAITPLGEGVECFWNGLKEGKRAFGEITAFDCTDYKAKMCAEVKDFDPTKYMDFKTDGRQEGEPSLYPCDDRQHGFR